MTEIVEFHDAQGRPAALVYGRKTNSRVRCVSVCSLNSAVDYEVREVATRQTWQLASYDEALGLALSRSG